MISIETLSLFFIASVALALAPGPDNIFVLTQSALHGSRAGLWVTLGLCTGLLAHTAAVAVGVAALFQASLVAFTTLKMAGAVYLFYLAWQAFRAGAAGLNAQAGVDVSWRRLYLRGVVMNVTNPKVAIFFLAFLPQFADLSRGPIRLQLLGFGGLFIIATILVFGGVALTAGYLGHWLKRSPKIQKMMSWLAGTVFAGLALRLVVSER